MQAHPITTAPALKALLNGFIDYAGVFPPAALSLEAALSNYESYRHSPYGWMLRSIVVQAAELPRVPAALDGCLAVLAEVDNERAASIESKEMVNAPRPVYVEVPLNSLEKLVAVKAAGCFAKIRTGGVKPEAIPDVQQVAEFIRACADLKLPFKATAGLHHPIRAEYPLTYDANSPRAVMHGFLNVVMGAAFAWHGKHDIEAIIAETVADAFVFDDAAHWRNQSLSLVQIREVRDKFMHSIGSCSFDEPTAELQKMGLLI